MKARTTKPQAVEIPEYRRMTIVRTEGGAADAHTSSEMIATSFGVHGLNAERTGAAALIMAIATCDTARASGHAAGHSILTELTLEQVRELRNKLTLILNANGSL